MKYTVCCALAFLYSYKFSEVTSINYDSLSFVSFDKILREVSFFSILLQFAHCFPQQNQFLVAVLFSRNAF